MRAEIDITRWAGRVHRPTGPAAMSDSEFPQLLARYMRRIRASAAGVASEIGMSREAVNNWRNGSSLPSPKHRDRLLGCAAYLRLTEHETNRFLASVGFEPAFPTDAGADIAASTPPAVQRVLDRLGGLRPYPVLMLLTQAHLGQPPEREALLEEATRRYGAGAVLHVQPPYSLAADAAGYFAAVASQCGFEGVDSDFGFEQALANRLQGRETLFCLVSRFEQGDPLLREVLAGILRSLSEMYSGRLHLLICGGAALADLKYQGGDLSLLNIATAEAWPELDGNDIRAMGRRAGLDEVDAARVLGLSGGHPLLADATLRMLAGDERVDDAEAERRLARHAPLLQSLPLVLAAPHAREAMAGWLCSDRLAPALPYALDPLLRALYWANLVVPRSGPDGNWLEWRCPAVRRACELILESGSGSA